MRLVSQIGDGHTSLYPPIMGESAWSMIPIWPIWLQDGWYVSATNSTHGHLLGAKILAAEGQDFETIIQEAVGYLGTDNDITHLWLAGVSLQFAELYQNAQSSSDDTISFSFQLSDGQLINEELPIGPIDRDPTTAIAPPHWQRMPNAAPLPVGDPFAHMQIKGTQAIYSRIDIVNDSDQIAFADYGTISHDISSTIRC